MSDILDYVQGEVISAARTQLLKVQLADALAREKVLREALENILAHGDAPPVLARSADLDAIINHDRSCTKRKEAWALARAALAFRPTINAATLPATFEAEPSESMGGGLGAGEAAAPQTLSGVLSTPGIGQPPIHADQRADAEMVLKGRMGE